MPATGARPTPDPGNVTLANLGLKPYNRSTVDSASGGVHLTGGAVHPAYPLECPAMSGYITPERVRNPAFMLAVLRGQTPPGVDPGSPEDVEIRELAADAHLLGQAAPAMTSEQLVTVVAWLRSA